MGYKKKYEELLKVVEDLAEISAKNAEAFEEPEWPDKIEDRKLVIQFRNAIFDRSFELGARSACHRILEFAKGQK